MKKGNVYMADSITFNIYNNDVEKFDKEIKENEMLTHVNVCKPDLKGKTKWGVTLDGRNITCEVVDEEFLERVHNGEISFTGSTTLYVRMITRYKTNGIGMDGEIVSQKIVEVIDVEN